MLFSYRNCHKDLPSFLRGPFGMFFLASFLQWMSWDPVWSIASFTVISLLS